MDERKLLLRERVEVRQFEEGLRGSWHAGVVIGVSKMCRSVEYDELLCETGESKLIEDILVSEAIEGLHRRRYVSSTYRGCIRPLPPSNLLNNSNFQPCFGICVDAFFEDAWWEGVIFDCEVESETRSVYFPDEGDERTFSVNNLRVSCEWDEFLGVWKDRGVWVLVELAKKIEGDIHLPNFVKRVWVNLQSDYGFQKMITEWTCCVQSLWDSCFRKVVGTITTESSQQHLCNASILDCIVTTEVNLSAGGQQADFNTCPYNPVVQVEDCNGSSVVRSNRNKNETSSLRKSKQKKQPLKERLKSEKQEYPLVHASKMRFQADDSCGTKEIMDNCLYQKKCKISQVCLSKRKQKFDEIMPIPKKLKPVITCRQESKGCVASSSKMNKEFAHDVSHVQDYQFVDRRRNKMKPKQVASAHASAFPIFRLGQSDRKASPVRTSQKNCSMKGKRVALKLQQAIADVVKEENSICVNDCHRKPLSDNCEQRDGLNYLVLPCLKRKRKRAYRGSKDDDSICIVCHYGGDIIFCDHCFSSYHLSCVGLEGTPDGKWFCPSCQCGLCGLRDPNSDGELFTEFCDQCGLQYHVDCLNRAGYLFRRYNLSANFCSAKCFELCTRLRQLLGTSNPTSVEGITWTMIRRVRNDADLYGTTRSESRKKLSLALGVLCSCFKPVIDPHTSRNLVVDVGRSSESSLKRLDFRGFYVMALQKGADFLSVATVRVHGHKVAEMPFIATNFQYRGLGMCRLLVHELEKMLTGLGVERLVLPAISQMRETWETSFGFEEMPLPEQRELLAYPLLGFRGTTLFHKVLYKSMTTRGRQGTFQNSEGNKSPACEGQEVLSDNGGKFRGLYQQRKQNMSICGKENMVKNYDRNKHVYTRRRILANEVPVIPAS